MKNLLMLLCFLITNLLTAQIWIDFSFQTTTETDIFYGLATNFAGRVDSLKLDVSLPQNDTPPACGRPLMVIVHGGGFLDGDKNEGYPARLRQDFAARGFVTASVNYRLGFFHTDRPVNCNVPLWNCLNATDSTEWYRAAYRGVQDVNGAIRYLVARSDEYDINPDNVFVVGESAGGFIALGVGFLDDPSEVNAAAAGELPHAPAPNQLYEVDCIKGYELAENIAAMDLRRPALGSPLADLSPTPARSYRIRGVGSFYGAAFGNYFRSFQQDPPALYLYHQTCDLIIPIGNNRLFSGYNSCFTNFPANCGNIINRPTVYGSRGIRDLIEGLATNGTLTNEYFYDGSSNNFSCLQQLDPNLSCHAIDNYALRTNNLATYFSGFVADCPATGTDFVSPSNNLLVAAYPNPVSSNLIHLTFSEILPELEVEIFDLTGTALLSQHATQTSHLSISFRNLPQGIYLAHLTYGNTRQIIRIVNWR